MGESISRDASRGVAGWLKLEVDRLGICTACPMAWHELGLTLGHAGEEGLPQKG